MDELIISHHLVKAESMDVFKSGSGRRRLEMPYYYMQPSDGSMDFHFISNATDPHWLEVQVKAGRIWILKKHLNDTH